MGVERAAPAVFGREHTFQRFISQATWAGLAGAAASPTAELIRVDLAR